MSAGRKKPVLSREVSAMEDGSRFPLSGECEDIDLSELGCGRSAENMEFSGKAAEWGCLLFVLLLAIAGVIAFLERISNGAL